ncbi:hypothetical protein PSTT_04253 [Puccinia striiformis]|uniref:Uncharacterized protein n=1 Tax=Puccinia striiformis TaxID=27350 RepID=A0A2S4VSS1_9BASI|nr:hypothetical protein PSTT_04253 [Puccinia striiformis]
MTGSTRDDTRKIYGMIVFHSQAGKTEAYKKLLRQEAKKDLLFNTEAKIIVLEDLMERGFDSQTSIVHPRIWTLRARGDGVLQNLGTPSLPKSDEKAQLQPR